MSRILLALLLAGIVGWTLRVLWEAALDVHRRGMARIHGDDDTPSWSDRPVGPWTEWSDREDPYGMYCVACSGYYSDLTIHNDSWHKT